MKCLKKSLALGTDLVGVALSCGAESEVVAGEQSSMFKNWKMLITSLCLAADSLRECRLTSRSALVSDLCMVQLKVVLFETAFIL